MNALSPIVALDVRPVPLDDPRLEPFVRAQPDATLFHLPQWSRVVERGTDQRAHCVVAERDGVLRGMLPLTEVRSRLFGNRLVSAGFGTGGGPLGEGAEALARAAWALAEERGCATIELRGGPVPAGWSRSEGVYANFDRDLPDNADTLLASIPKRQRAEVKKGLAEGLETSAGTDRRHRDAHFRVYAESVRNLGTPVFPRALFEAALDEFGEAADIVIVWKDGRPLSALLNFYFNGICQPFWGGGTREARNSRANDVAYFDVMRRAIERGFRRADFGRSKVGTGPYMRKKIWDFEETPLVYSVRTADGEAPRIVNPLDPKYRLKVAAWRKLPLWLANRAGPVIARGLG